MTMHSLSGNLALADKRLAARLRLHAALHTGLLISRNPFLSPIYAYLTLALLAQSLIGIDSSREFFLFALCFTLPFWISFSIPIWWRRNLDHLSRIDNIAVVGPLLDLADFTQRRRFMLITCGLFICRPIRLISYKKWAELVVVHRLPTLLNRMNTGDFPLLSKRRHNTLRNLLQQSQV